MAKEDAPNLTEILVKVNPDNTRKVYGVHIPLPDGRHLLRAYLECSGIHYSLHSPDFITKNQKAGFKEFVILDTAEEVQAWKDAWSTSG